MENISSMLLPWFYASRRVLPFRSDPTPYHIWVSEIMLQQTRVAAAVPYYERFIAELPDIPSLAACDEERLHKLWEGLGYYSRVRNLQKAAKLVCAQYGGQLPCDLAALKALPGIGDYTAGAIASIGFGLAAPAVDGNVMRVFARLYGDAGDILLPETKRRFTLRVMEHQPPDAPGDYNQALMELGALVCLPGGAPNCAACPLSGPCAAHADGCPERLPVKTPPKMRRRFAVTLALVRDAQGYILLQKRPETGLLAGLWQPPILAMHTLAPGAKAVFAPPQQELRALVADAVSKSAVPLTGKHIFTHLEWQMAAWRFSVPCQPAPEGCVWAAPDEVASRYALPGAFKAFRTAMTTE